jgi:3-hydroxyisobutyrate dehydrogenase
MMRIGFIGLGDQGGPMAEMMLKAGLPLSVWARRPEVAARFVSAGATSYESPDQSGAESDLLGLCVTADEDVRSILLDQGALAAMRPGAVVAIHATVRPALCRELASAAAGLSVHLIDAPVSGSGRAAREKSLLVMAGGDRAVFDRVKGVFESYASVLLHVGPVGSAMAAKLVNNLLAAVQLGLAHRALQLGERQGLAPDLLREAVLAGTGASFAIDATRRLSDPARAAHIHRILSKDVALALEEMAPEDAAYWGPLAQSSLNALEQLAAERKMDTQEGARA